MKNKKIIGIILALIVLAGIIVTCIYGLNFGLNYTNHKEVDIYIGKEFENQDIYAIAKEVLENKKISVQKVELYEDMVSIKVKDITDEQLESLNTKINEKYGIENTIENIVVTNVSNVKLRDLVKPYILPVAISFVIIIIYLVIYNAVYSHMGREVNGIKIVLKAIASIILVQLLYLSILAITRLEINGLTIPVAIVLYSITTIVIFVKLEKENTKTKNN